MNSEVLNQKCLFEENNKNNFLNESEIKKETDLNQMFPCSANNSVNMSCPIDFQPIPSRVIPLDGLELVFRAPSAAKFLILAIKDRIRHGRHFTFKGQKFAVTFVAESVTGSIVSKQNPFGIIGFWMQVLISDDLVQRMVSSFENLPDNPDDLSLPHIFEYPDKNLRIVIDNPTTPQ